MNKYTTNKYKTKIIFKYKTKIITNYYLNPINKELDKIFKQKILETTLKTFKKNIRENIFLSCLNVLGLCLFSYLLYHHVNIYIYIMTYNWTYMVFVYLTINAIKDLHKTLHEIKKLEEEF